MGDFCPSCLVVYRTDDTDLPMVQCDTCDRWIHTGVYVAGGLLKLEVPRASCLLALQG